MNFVLKLKMWKGIEMIEDICNDVQKFSNKDLQIFNNLFLIVIYLKRYQRFLSKSGWNWLRNLPVVPECSMRSWENPIFSMRLLRFEKVWTDFATRWNVRSAALLPVSLLLTLGLKQVRNSINSRAKHKSPCDHC